MFNKDHKKSARLTLLAATSCLGVLTFSQSARAQSTAPAPAPAPAQPTTTAPDPQEGLSDIVVTAQRRSENLQSVPLAITAFSGKELTEGGIHDLTGLATRVPGLTFSPFAPGQNIVALRGVSSNDDGAGTDNSVAVFVDGVYSGRVSNINPEMFDIQSVEVLRGPQGTLYGKNTIGGAIVINSTLPNADRLDARIRGDVGNFGLLSVSGLLSGPFGDGWAGKIAFNVRHRDGWAYNRVLKEREQNDNTQNVRGQIAYNSGGFHALLSADYNHLSVADIGRIPLTQITGALGPLVTEYQAVCGPNGIPRCVANPVSGYSRRDDGGVSLKFDLDTGVGTVTSISAFRKSRVEWLMDSVGVPQFPLGDLIRDASRQFSQEFRLSGSRGNFKYVFGLFYLNEKTDRTEIFDFAVQGDYSNSSQYTQNNTLNSYAAFGQVDWEILPRLVLTAGGRFTYEKKNIDNSAFAGDFPVISTTFANSREASWQRFTPKGTIAFHPNNVSTIYASISEGFKSGGFAAAPTTVQDTDPLRQELATNYEAGVKTELFDRTLRVNTSVFYTKYKDLQYQAFGPRPGIAEFGIFRTVNLKSAEAAGVEFEVDWQPVRNLNLSGSYAYLYSRYLDAIIPTSSFPNQNGQDLIRAPRNKYSVNARYTVPLGTHGDVTAGAGYQFTDNQRGELEPYAIQPRFGLVDARLAWMSASKHVEIAVWGKNILDKAYVAHVYTVGGEVIGSFGQPASFGLSVTLKN